MPVMIGVNGKCLVPIFEYSERDDRVACRMYRVLFLLISIYGSIHGNAVSSQFPNKGNVPRQYHSRFLMYEEPYNIEFKYHNYEQMSRFLRATSLRFQNLTALYSIGKSVKGRKDISCAPGDSTHRIRRLFAMQRIAKRDKEIKAERSNDNMFRHRRSRFMGDGRVVVALRAHDRETRRKVHRQHTRKRGRWTRIDAASHSRT